MRSLWISPLSSRYNCWQCSFSQGSGVQWEQWSFPAIWGPCGLHSRTTKRYQNNKSEKYLECRTLQFFFCQILLIELVNLVEDGQVSRFLGSVNNKVPYDLFVLLDLLGCHNKSSPVCNHNPNIWLLPSWRNLVNTLWRNCNLLNVELLMNLNSFPASVASITVSPTNGQQKDVFWACPVLTTVEQISRNEAKTNLCQ